VEKKRTGKVGGTGTAGFEEVVDGRGRGRGAESDGRKGKKRFSGGGPGFT